MHMHILTEYTTRNHAIARIDARVKIIVTFAMLLLVLSYRGFAFPGAVTVCCLALCVGLRIPLRSVALRYSEPLFIAAVFVLLKLFFSGSEPLFTMKIAGVGLTGHADGLREGLRIAVRIIASVSLVAVLGFSTPFTDIMAGLSWYRLPQGFIEVLMFAYRYIFVLFDDAMVIYTAQRNRLGYSSIRRGLSSFGVLAGSLTLKAFENSQNTTVAMVQRGYDGTMPMPGHKTFKASEIAGSVALIIGAALIWKI